MSVKCRYDARETRALERRKPVRQVSRFDEAKSSVGLRPSLVVDRYIPNIRRCGWLEKEVRQ